MNSQKILLSMLLAVSIGCLPLIAVAKGEKANDDEYYIFEDNPGVVLEVLLNDNYNEPAIIKIAGVTVTIDGIDYPNSSESRPSTIIDPFGQAVTLPNGTVIANPDGTVTYKPKPNFKGWDHFHYTFKDDKKKTKEGRGGYQGKRWSTTRRWSRARTTPWMPTMFLLSVPRTAC